MIQMGLYIFCKKTTTQKKKVLILEGVSFKVFFYNTDKHFFLKHCSNNPTDKCEVLNQIYEIVFGTY